MADDQDVLLRFLNMLRGSLDEKNQRLLEELRLKRPAILEELRRKRSVVLSRPARDSLPAPQKGGGNDPGLSPGVAA